MQFQPRSTRFVALFTGFVLASTALGVAPAHAIEKSKTLKYGAIALGVVGAYLLSKGKTVPAVAAAAGGYYVYKKSQDAHKNERYGNNRDRYGYYPSHSNGGNYNGGSYSNGSYNGDVYPDDSNTGYRYGSNAVVRERKQAKGYDLSPYLR